HVGADGRGVRLPGRLDAGQVAASAASCRSAADVVVRRTHLRVLPHADRDLRPQSLAVDRPGLPVLDCGYGGQYAQWRGAHSACAAAHRPYAQDGAGTHDLARTFAGEPAF